MIWLELVYLSPRTQSYITETPLSGRKKYASTSNIFWKLYPLERKFIYKERFGAANVNPFQGTLSVDHFCISECILTSCICPVIFYCDKHVYTLTSSAGESGLWCKIFPYRWNSLQTIFFSKDDRTRCKYFLPSEGFSLPQNSLTII